MGALIAFGGTAAIVAIVQTARWWRVRSRAAPPTTWTAYVRSPGAWAGWPLAMVIGTYALLMVMALAVDA